MGGIAGRAYGAERATHDVDCLAHRSIENLSRLASAMRALNARLRVEGLSDEEAAALHGFIDGERLARMEISTWRTDAGDFDVLADMPDRVGRHLRYEELAPRANIVRYGGIDVRVASLEDVIASKEWADAPRTVRLYQSFVGCGTPRRSGLVVVAQTLPRLNEVTAPPHACNSSGAGWTRPRRSPRRHSCQSHDVDRSTRSTTKAIDVAIHGIDRDPGTASDVNGLEKSGGHADQMR